MENTRLYEITGAYAEAAAALMACETDEEYEQALAQFEGIEADMAQKGAAMARILRNMQARGSVQKAQEDAFKLEAKRLEAKRKATEAAADRLKEQVLFAMETAGLERIRTDVGTWYIGASMSCKVLDAQAVPREFIKGFTPEIDKDAAKKHYAFTGEIIPGLEITQGRSARFR